MMTYEATYDPSDNKLRLRADGRLDSETYALARELGFVWAPKQKVFVAPKWTPAREDFLIELAGEIGDEGTSLADRASQRAKRFAQYGDNRERDAASAKASVDAIADNIPLGQPILIGHHSQRRAERDAEKIRQGMRKTVQMWETATYWRERAEGVISHASDKERPDVRARRIKGIESDRRRQERVIADSENFKARWNKAESISLDDALAITNIDHIKIRPNGKSDWTSLWSALADGAISPTEARERALKAHEKSIAYARRWINHYDNRLAYERAMLAASGYKDPEKKKSAAAVLPLLNYKGEGFVEMTKEEYAKLYADYKRTKVIDGTHRVRYTFVSTKFQPVFLTDSKIHKRPDQEKKVSA